MISEAMPQGFELPARLFIIMRFKKGNSQRKLRPLHQHRIELKRRSKLGGGDFVSFLLQSVVALSQMGFRSRWIRFGLLCRNWQDSREDRKRYGQHQWGAEIKPFDSHTTDQQAII